MSLDPVSQTLLAAGPCERPAAPCRLVAVDGPDAGEFLQRLCSQDVLGLPEGGVALATFLDAKGKLLVVCRVARLEGGFWLEVDADQESRLCELLERYHFSERLRIQPAGLACAETIRAGECLATARRLPDGGIEIVFARRGLCFTHHHGGAAAAAAVGAAAMADAAAECLRMAAGLVRVGVESEASTLALEADLGDHCSTTKGCYTGQEIVARIHTYGHTNRKLCFLQLAAGAAIAAPAPLCDDDEIAVGRVLHAVPVPGQAMRCGLGYLPKDFQAAGTQLRLADGGAVIVLW